VLDSLDSQEESEEAMTKKQIEAFTESLNRNYGPPFLPEDVVKAHVTDDGFCLTIGPRDVDFDNDLRVLGAGTCCFEPPDLIPDDKDELKRLVKYYRAFARQTRDIIDSGAEPKEKYSAIAKNISVYKNQWPNWLDEPGQ
jgi:hypothetical protein